MKNGILLLTFAFLLTASALAWGASETGPALSPASLAINFDAATADGSDMQKVAQAQCDRIGGAALLVTHLENSLGVTTMIFTCQG